MLLSTATATALFVFAPGLVAALRARPRAVQVAALLAFVVPIHVLSIEVTGTNPTLQWNLSPWPTLTLCGFLLLGLLMGVIHLAAGIALGGLVAAVLAIALRPIPFEASSPLRLVALAAPAALLAACAGRHRAGAAAFTIPTFVPALRQPHIGWLDRDEEVFTYTDLGDSFLLEFSGPIWVQCAYSPPYQEEVTEAAAGGERLEAAWSCERKPPRLW